MYQSQTDRTERTYIAEHDKSWKGMVRVLLWINFAMLVINAALATHFWLSGSGPAYLVWW